MTRRRLLRPAVFLLALAVALAALWRLEAPRQTLSIRALGTGPAPATVYAQPSGASGLVVVAHGFGGSRQMMQAISLTLARAGRVVVAFDFPGHGRNPEPMSPDVTRIEGTTEQLVERTLGVIEAARAELGTSGPVALLGHSMATDVMVRAAERREDVGAVVAISMYSEAVTPAHPERLLVISGAWEPRLREVALEAVRQVEPGTGEGETVRAEGVARRAVAAPRVEHVGVLYSPETLREVRDWIAPGAEARPAVLGPWILALLAAIVAMLWPLAALLPRRAEGERVLPPGHFVLILVAPALPAIAAAAFLGGALLGFAAFGRLVLFLFVYGAVQLALLHRAGVRLGAPGWAGPALLLLWGLAVFAPALDRYFSSFLATGPRLPLAAALLVGTVPFKLAEAHLAWRASRWRRILARVVALAALTAAMLLVPQSFGLLFTALPVLVLFWLVYGLMGRWVAERSGPDAAGWALAILLAFALAASQPLFAAP